MPNDCENIIIIFNENNSLINRLENALNNEDFFKEFIPIENNIEDWCFWCCENWGTKWDAYDINYTLLKKNTLRIKFNTAWSPPIPVYERLENIGFIIEAWYNEPGMGFCGKYIKKNNYTYSYELKDLIPEEIKDLFSIDKIIYLCEYGLDQENIENLKCVEKLNKWIYQNIDIEKKISWGKFRIVKMDYDFDDEAKNPLFFWNGHNVVRSFNRDEHKQILNMNEFLPDNKGFIPCDFLAFQDYSLNDIFIEGGIKHNTYFYTQFQKMNYMNCLLNSTLSNNGKDIIKLVCDLIFNYSDIKKISHTKEGNELHTFSKYIYMTIKYKKDTYYLISWKYYDKIEVFYDVISKIKLYFSENKFHKFLEIQNKLNPFLSEDHKDLFYQTKFNDCQIDNFFFLFEEEKYISELIDDLNKDSFIIVGTGDMNAFV
jgi:hypothetical protein